MALYGCVVVGGLGGVCLCDSVWLYCLLVCCGCHGYWSVSVTVVSLSVWLCDIYWFVSAVLCDRIMIFCQRCLCKLCFDGCYLSVLLYVAV